MPIQSGKFVFTKDNYPQMMDNNPPVPRNAQDFISFPTAFAGTPTVVVSIFQLDSIHDFNTRVIVNTDTVNPTGFELVLSTWADSQLWSVGVSWIAYYKV